MPRVSIKNIAQQLGVSNATVSLVLNGKEKEGRIGKVIAEKIKATAKLLNYEPNSLARGLRVGYSNTIGLIVADISNVFFASLAFHIQECAEKSGYTVIITNTNESDVKMAKMIQTLKNRQVDGFIIIPTENGEEQIARLHAEKMPLVLLDRYFPDIPLSYVVVNNFQSSFDATNLLIHSGCRKIAMITYKNKLTHMQERKKGYSEALRLSNLSDHALIKEISYGNITEDIVTVIDELLKEEKKVDGIFFSTNSISMIGIRRMMQLKIRIPEEVKVVCFDKSDAFDFVGIPIPYVQQPISEMGIKSVENLIAQIKNENPCLRKEELFSTLMNVET